MQRKKLFFILLHLLDQLVTNQITLLFIFSFLIILRRNYGFKGHRRALMNSRFFLLRTFLEKKI